MDGPGYIRMAPQIVPVSELRRSFARLIERTAKSHAPLFVTQRGFVTAVLMSRDDYEALRLDQDGLRSNRRTPSAAARGRPQEEFVWPAATIVQEARSDDDLASRPVWTQYGWSDYASAQALAEQGVTTDLVLTEDGWVLDDEG